MLDQDTASGRLRGHDVIVFDGVCVLCSAFMRFVLKHDTARRYRFVIAQSDLGEALYAKTGLKSADYDTNLVVRNGQLYQKLDAFIVVMRDLGWPWRALAIFRPLPLPVKNWLYDRIARNRYRIFGRTRCLPGPGRPCERSLS